jgi:hypothetical protein
MIIRNTTPNNMYAPFSLKSILEARDRAGFNRAYTNRRASLVNLQSMNPRKLR